MTRFPYRFRFVGLGAGGLLLSGLLPLAAAEPPAVGPTAPPTVTHWQAFWDRYRAPCATIPPGAIPYPLGTSTRAWEDGMAERAAEDQFVVYQHEWYMGGLTLGPYGSVHLKRIAALLPQRPVRVVLQPEPSPELNEGRRLLLVHLLLSEGVADADQRVVIDFPRAEGMTAIEAARIYSRGISGYGGAGGNGINAGFGNPLQPTLGGLTPIGGGFQGGFRGGLNGGFTGY